MTTPTKLIYIAGPFRGANAYEVHGNCETARLVGFVVASGGAIPVIPHAMYEHFNGTLSDQFWLNATMEIMRRCNAVLACGEWVKSSGTRAELEEAKRLGIPVLYSRGELELFLGGEAGGGK